MRAITAILPVPSGGAVTPPPFNTAAPVASGSLTVGSTLSVTNGTWSNSPTGYTYQWLRNGASISGATSASYLTVTADGGTNVSCQVTATNAGGSASATSNALAISGAASSTWSTADATTTGMTLTNANMTVTGTSAWNTMRGTSSHSSGKYYVEFLAGAAATSNQIFGVANAGFVPTSYLSTSNYSAGSINGSPNYVSAGFTSNYTASLGGTIALGDVFALAVDFGAGSIWLAKNNVWADSGVPATGALPIISFVPATVGALFPAISITIAGQPWTLQAAAGSQTYAPPTGFTAWG